MEKEDFYTQWKEYRRHVRVPENFSNSVMTAVENQAPGNDDALPIGSTDFSNRIIRWGVAAGLMMLGLFRILYIAGSLLRANPLMPY
jgi:hypothetical protein